MVDTVILDSNDDLAYAGDLANGANLMSVLPAGTGYKIFREGDGSLDFDVSALTAGTIDQATPTVGDTLTVSGSNAPAGATFQWQRDTGGGQADISGATSATYDTTGQATGDYRRGVTSGVQGPVYTSAVTVAAAVSYTTVLDFTGAAVYGTQWYTPTGQTGTTRHLTVQNSETYVNGSVLWQVGLVSGKTYRFTGSAYAPGALASQNVHGVIQKPIGTNQFSSPYACDRNYGSFDTGDFLISTTGDYWFGFKAYYDVGWDPAVDLIDWKVQEKL